MVQLVVLPPTKLVLGEVVEFEKPLFSQSTKAN
jgi:hypothetical protein